MLTRFGLPARAALALGCALALAGCALGSSTGSSVVAVTVTRDFGAQRLARATAAQAARGDTVMRFLQHHFKVGASGGFVASIDGLAGGRPGALSTGPPVAWFFYVNGIAAPLAAASTALHPGDRILWDRHDWRGAQRVPAIVGLYPQPFRSALDGKRVPVVVACADAGAPACRTVDDRLAAIGINPGRSDIAAGAGQDVLRVLVGTWAQIRADAAAAQLASGPARSGVFARFDATGRLELLDPTGRPRRTLAAGAGLIAATRYADQQPTWLVTGSDGAGVLAAARHLDVADLADRFALALTGSALVALPLAA